MKKLSLKTLQCQTEILIGNDLMSHSGSFMAKEGSKKAFIIADKALKKKAIGLKVDK
jgi:alcohol dehydrogenase class IV